MSRTADEALISRRFEDAAEAMREESELADLLQLGLGWGRYRLVKSLMARSPGSVTDRAWSNFLWDRALPRVPWRHVDGVVYVDEAVLVAIASDLGLPPERVAARACAALLEGGTCNPRKALALAVRAGDAALRERATAVLSDRSCRAGLEAALCAAWPAGELLQRGDVDDVDPKSAWLMRCPHEGALRVMKEVLRQPIDWTRIDATSDEPALLGLVTHANLVRCFGVERVGGFEVMGLDFIAQARRAWPDEALAIVRDVVAALTALHAVGIAVLDLKRDNVLWDGRRAVLIDLGYAQRVSGETPTLHGSPLAVPPEVLRRWRGGTASDMWQLGALWFDLLTDGEHPYAGRAVDVDSPGARVYYGLATLHEPSRLERLADPKTRAVIGALLDPRPSARPTATELASSLGALA